MVNKQEVHFEKIVENDESPTPFFVMALIYFFNLGGLLLLNIAFPDNDRLGIISLAFLIIDGVSMIYVITGYFVGRNVYWRKY